MHRHRVLDADDARTCTVHIMFSLLFFLSDFLPKLQVSHCLGKMQSNIYVFSLSRRTPLPPSALACSMHKHCICAVPLLSTDALAIGHRQIGCCLALFTVIAACLLKASSTSTVFVHLRLLTTLPDSTTFRLARTRVCINCLTTVHYILDNNLISKWTLIDCSSCAVHGCIVLTLGVCFSVHLLNTELFAWLLLFSRLYSTMQYFFGSFFNCHCTNNQLLSLCLCVLTNRC